MFGIILGVLILSFLLAWRGLGELEVPEEAKKTLQKISLKTQVSGIIIFLRDKVLHYQTQN